MHAWVEINDSGLVKCYVYFYVHIAYSLQVYSKKPCKKWKRNYEIMDMFDCLEEFLFLLLILVKEFHKKNILGQLSRNVLLAK